MKLACTFGFHKWDGCKCNACGKTRELPPSDMDLAGYFRCQYENGEFDFCGTVSNQHPEQCSDPESCYQTLQYLRSRGSITFTRVLLVSNFGHNFGRPPTLVLGDTGIGLETTLRPEDLRAVAMRLSRDSSKPVREIGNGFIVELK